ncbi:MAG: TolC family protein [Myxococcales bacterium]|nr:TolC family protein [Myxococcales bacterium]
MLLSSGCARYLEDNKAREVSRAVPDSYGGAYTGAATTADAQRQWDQFFSDPFLQALIREALDNNQELNIRLQEIIIAQNEIAARKGEYLPRLDAGVGVGVEKVGQRTSQGASDMADGVPEHLPYFGFGLSAAWEIDIWKKLRNAAKSADYRYRATIEARNFIITQIVAEIAEAYYELLALDNQIEVLDRNIGIQQDALEIVKLKKEAARATELGVQRFQAEVTKNQGRRFELLQQRVEAENRINFLVGRFPQRVARDPAKFMDTEPAPVNMGLPSQLLDNRPDVRQASYELEASKLDVKVAKARFYPSLSLEAGVGYESFNVVHLLDTPESLLYNVAGNLTAPLLNRAAIKADYRAANAMQIQAVFNFERTLLLAFTEVVNYLRMVENLAAQFERQTVQVETLEQATETSNILYRSARADYMEVLMTRRDSLEAEMELIETRKQQMQARVGIYRALGGGWRREPAA